MAASPPYHAVMFMSGYTEDSVIRPGAQEDNLEFLGKPLSPEELAKRVRETLKKAGIAPSMTRF